MIIAILGDTHLGARGGVSHFNQFFNKFYAELFYPYLIKHNIKHIIQLGDIFDNRTSLSIKAYADCKHIWFNPLVENQIHMTIILGNHDIHHKNTLKINTPSLLLGEEYSDHIRIIDKPSILLYDTTTVAAIPWICDENKELIYDFLKPDKIADLCMGHFEIDGFEMMRGISGKGGMPRDLFDKFEHTFSGHYHTRSNDEYHRIQYVGTPYEITYADMHDPKGFHIFDTNTRQIEFIENPFTMFDRIVYNDESEMTVPNVKGKYVKLVVEKKNDLKKFDSFVNAINGSGVQELSIIENFSALSGGEVDVDIKTEDSPAIINGYIDNLTVAVDKQQLKDYLQGIYQEAITE